MAKNPAAVAPDIAAANARQDARMESIVRAKLNDPTARIARWQQNRNGSQTPIWSTTKPADARALGLTIETNG